VLQIIEITPRVVVCLNLMDEADRRGLSIDVARLEHELGVPVAPTTARHGRGLAALMDRVRDVATGVICPRPRRSTFGQRIEDAVARLQARLLEAIPDLPCARWVAVRLLDHDERVRAALASGELARLAANGAGRRDHGDGGP